MEFMRYTSLLILSLISVFWGCQKKSETRSVPMHVCLNMDPTTVDSRKNADPCTSTFHFLIYEGLTRMNEKGEGELALAESVCVSEDGKTYTFRLKEALWSDKEPITAFDFEHSWKKTLTPDFGSPCPYLLFPVKNAEKAIQKIVSPDEVAVKAIDARTLQVELENPTPYFLSLITFCNFYPIPRHVEVKNGSWDSAPDANLVVSGPYRLAKWERNKEILLEKNPFYWDAKNVHLDKILLSIISNEKTALQMYERGELDFLGTMTSPLSVDDLAYSKEKRILQVQPLGGLLFCTFNMNRFPFQNENIRKAFSLAINRDAIVQNITQLSETAATRCVPPVLAGNKNRKLFPSFAPEEAKKYFELALKELEIEAKILSQEIEFTYEGEDLYRRIAQAIQQQWKEVLGIEVKIAEHDRKTLITKHMQRNYSVGMDRFIAQYNDPYNILERFKHKNGTKNLPGFESSDYAYFLDEAATINDPAKRLETLNRAEEVLIDAMPIAPIFHFNQGVLIHPKFENVAFSPLGNLLFKNLTLKDEPL